ncbi:toxin-antitoxin system YwqK family antitoxin [Chryseobacterium wangxinyae]|uniref:toxin-antitoxin system YwqK family antitoxin n=1 Tax=Chryseobacterium sp. CY353 TaxID=2997334 RepID=UPI00226E292C|nr:hypothetical protein [Chryseobacterium sp. CY353]MCY0968049.1 hypothetical protein [Chryseobacterium sp. CY353]
MMKNIVLTLISIFVFVCCKTKEINQYKKFPDKSQKRHGTWREEYSSDRGTLIALGKYKNGEKVGVWKTTFEDKLYQKDKIRKNLTKTKLYHSNGKIMEKGQSRLDISDVQRHWYYFGDWTYYDENGKLKYVKKYSDGKKVDSISFLR